MHEELNGQRHIPSTLEHFLWQGGPEIARPPFAAFRHRQTLCCEGVDILRKGMRKRRHLYFLSAVTKVGGHALLGKKGVDLDDRDQTAGPQKPTGLPQRADKVGHMFERQTKQCHIR